MTPSDASARHAAAAVTTVTTGGKTVTGKIAAETTVNGGNVRTVSVINRCMIRILSILPPPGGRYLKRKQVIFSQLGDTLATIAAQEAICAPDSSE